MSSNDVFALADLNALDSTIDLNDVEYYDLSNIKKYSIDSTGEKLDNNKFIHIVYFIGSSSVGAEFVEKFTITCGGKDYHFNIGADFYQEDEKLTITVQEAARLLGIGRNIMLELVTLPDFPAIRFKRKILINKAQLQNWLDNNSGKFGNY